ncbi:hypothetical protein QYM36_010191 [Artemia franciscana]|uniref:Uncharacterized protein n=1 Tax=Artemia franciscana TaxID=6661 RepID=A0AA88L7J7_ARTSF|nr:hypothetical protein QYM36_010191 [Artemia franciscana]
MAALNKAKTEVTPHTANKTVAWLRQRFEERLITRNCDVEWALHSPDLNPPDSYLRDFIRDNAYQGNPKTIEELKTVTTSFNVSCQKDSKRLKVAHETELLVRIKMGYTTDKMGYTTDHLKQ